MSDIDDVKQKIAISEYVGRYVKLSKAGKNFKGLCPFHSEKTPSFMVNPERGTFHCFGCGKGGSVFDFAMEYHRIDFREALESLADEAGIILTKSSASNEKDKQKELLYEINALAAEYYQYIFSTHDLGQKARQYVSGRGISQKVATTFQIGYSPNSWDALRSFLLKKGYHEKTLEDAGLAIASARGGYDRFRGRLMFPQKDFRGRVVGFSGRLLDPNPKEAKYINTSETLVYIKGSLLYGLDVTKDAIKKEGPALLVEGEFDLLSLFQAGYSNVVAIKGSALTEGHIHILKRFTDTLIFALDSDVAGDTASRRGIALADSTGFDMKVARMPSGKDPDEAVRSNAPAVGLAIKQAEPIYDFLMRSSLSRFDIQTPSGKKKAGDELLPIFAAIENTIVQAHYIKQLAKKLDVSEDAIGQGIRKILRSHFIVSKSTDIDKGEKVKKSRIELLESYLLAIALQGKTKELLEEHVPSDGMIQIVSPFIAAVFSRLQKAVADTNVFFASDFGNMLPSELMPVFEEAMLADLSEFIDEEGKVIEQWEKTIRELQKMNLREQITVLSQKASDEALTENERSDISEKLSALTKKRKELEVDR